MLARMAAIGAAGRPQPTFVSSSINRVAVAANTVTAPSGIQNGDLLVAIGYASNAGLTVTPPTGFSIQYTDTTNSSMFVAVKTAASESGNYTWTWSSAVNNNVAILVYRNATALNTQGAKTYSAASATGTGATITPTYTGTLVAAFGVSSNLSVSTPPTGMTQRAAQTANNPSFVIYDLAGQAASATGDKTITWSASNQNTSSLLLQITNETNVAPEYVASATTSQSASASTLTINKPTGTIEGDLLVSIVFSGANTTWTGDTGWTEVADLGANPSQRVAYKTAGASEPSSYTFTAANGGPVGGTILTYRYAAYDVVGAFTEDTNPLVLPSISPTTSQSLLIASGGRNAASLTVGTPTSMTARVVENDANAPSYTIAEQKVAKGQTGTRSMSVGSTNNPSGILFAIKPTRSLT